MIIDSENKLIGRVSDAILHRENLEMCGLVIKGEKDERVELDDFEERILPIEYFDEITNDTVLLNTTMSSIDTSTCDKLRNKKEVIRFSELSNLQIYDESNRIVGNVGDIVFLDEILVELNIEVEYMKDLASRFKYAPHLVCGASVKELDISAVDIHLKLSQSELERRVKLFMDSEFESLYFSETASIIEKSEFKVSQIRYQVGSIR